jgi:hypothetical protein
MKRVIVFLILSASALLIMTPAHAQGPITVSANNFTNNFPAQLVFQLEAQSSAKITDVALITQIDSVPSSGRQLPQFTSDNQVKVRYEWSLNRNYLPPGVGGQYWWTIRDGAGNNLETPKQPFRVEDTSHAWKKLSNEQLALNWYPAAIALAKLSSTLGLHR